MQKFANFPNFANPNPHPYPGHHKYRYEDTVYTWVSPRNNGGESRSATALCMNVKHDLTTPANSAISITSSIVVPIAYVFSSFYCNFWLIVGKLGEARSQLYQRRFLQLNTRLNSYLVRKEIEKKGHEERQLSQRSTQFTPFYRSNTLNIEFYTIEY